METKEKRPLLIDNINKYPHIDKSGWAGYANPSLLAFPLLDNKNEVCGLIALHNKKNSTFKKHDLDYGILMSSYSSETLQAVFATEEIIKGEKKYRTLVETMNDGLVLLDDKYCITYANNRFCKILGYTQLELFNKNIGEFLDDASQIEVINVFRHKKHAQTYEVVWIRKDSKKKTSLLSVQPYTFLKSEKNDPCYFVVVTDITARKNSEKALQQKKYESDMRVKELNCLFTISSMFEKMNISTEEIVKRTIDVIPQAFQYPSNTCVKISLHTKTYCTQSCTADYCKKTDNTNHFIAYPISVSGIKVGIITVWYRGQELPKKKSPFLKEEARLINAVADLLGSIIERKKSENALQTSVDKLQTAMEGIIQAMAMTTEMRDPYTAGHQRRVSKLASAIAIEMGLSKEDIDGIRLAGIIHDIGKIHVPAEILSKPGQISDIEFSIIKTHAQIGHDILKTIEFPWPLAKIVHQHHEHLDGSGYPLGLRGNNILLAAQILSVADTVEAMASHRPYRPSLGIKKALEEIKENAGKHYSPEVVTICTDLFERRGFKFD